MIFHILFYSERPKTLAQRKYEDDIPLEVKKERLQEVIDLQRVFLESNRDVLEKLFEVLVEGPSKKSEDNFAAEIVKYYDCFSKRKM